MPRTWTVDHDRLAAGIAVVGAHAAFWWLLTRAAMVPITDDAQDDALQVRWIERPAIAAPVPTVAAGAPSPPRRPRGREAGPRATGPGPAPQHDAPATDTPMSAVFIEQGHRLARGLAEGDAATADPFADRPAALPGHAGGTFRMREPPSLQGALRKIGQLVGGPGYSTDPCSRIRDNIAGLANGEGAERELLAEELRRKRALCD